jgi:pimeloyl-ACP methyl ester carboxylesterase
VARTESGVRFGSREITLRLQLEHDSFGRKTQTAFKNALAAATGCEPGEIEIIGIKRGCINVRLRLPRHAFEALCTFWEQYEKENKDLDEIDPKFRVLLEQFKLDKATYIAELQLVVRSAPSSSAVVFVHGWLNTPDAFGEWPNYLHDEFGCAVYVYPHPISASAPSIRDVATNMRQWVKNDLPQRKLAFIAHSIGGLVVRQYVLDTHHGDRQDLYIKCIAFLASANAMDIKPISSLVPGLTGQHLNDFADQKPTLQNIAMQWPRWRDLFVPRDCQLVSFYGSSDKLVPSSSMNGLDGESIAVLGKTHEGIAKPGAQTDELVKTVRRYLMDAKLFTSEQDGSRQEYWSPNAAQDQGRQRTRGSAQ